MQITETLNYILPSLVVLIASFATIWLFLRQENKKQQLKINLANNDLITPIRLQAYERLILFLERISPSSLILRVHQPGINALQLQTMLLNTIREEYEHNLSQQLYVSTESWHMLQNAKEEIIRIINLASSKINIERATSEELSTKIFETSLQIENLKTILAIESIKKEIQILFKS